MTGDSITGNTASDSTSYGGVYFSSGTFNLSGAPELKGNVKGGTITNRSLTGGDPNNVYLDSGKIITVTPAAGYKLSSLSVFKTGDTSTTVTVANNTFTMPDYPVTVTAVFVPVFGPATFTLPAAIKTIEEKAAPYDRTPARNVAGVFVCYWVIIERLRKCRPGGRRESEANCRFHRGRERNGLRPQRCAGFDAA